MGHARHGRGSMSVSATLDEFLRFHPHSFRDSAPNADAGCCDRWYECGHKHSVRAGRAVGSPGTQVSSTDEVDQCEV